MGKTYRRQPSSYDDDKQGHRKGKNSGHSNNKKTGGMRIVNLEEDDDIFDDGVYFKDQIVINKTSDDKST